MVSLGKLPVDYAGSTATVDLAAMERNLDLLKRRSGTDRVLAVVKADMYGHGAVAVAGRLEEKVSGFAVATVDEGIQLREAGIRCQILVFGVPDGLNREAYPRWDLTATISSAEHFNTLAKGCSYQINFDTGMRRLGFTAEEAWEVRRLIDRHGDLYCRGVYSHYSTADEPGSQEVYRQQERMRQLKSGLGLDVPFHMSNTAAVVHYDLEHFDMIRVGIGLTGYTPGTAQDNSLEPALRWMTVISQSRPIGRGEAVSYGGNWTAPEDGTVMTLPVGYADGVPRALGNRLHVHAGGETLPQVGNITMDHMMIYSSSMHLEPGTEVELMGGAGWRANVWAEHTGSITHEIFCRITPRVARRYTG